MKTTILSLIAAVIISFSSQAHDGPYHGWTLLGTKSVDWRFDKDVIHVGGAEGSFARLKIKVSGGAVHIRKMVVKYGNGSKDEITVQHHFRKGAESRVIDLEGGKRKIKNITFVYDRKNPSKSAKVWVAGRY